MIQYSTLSSRWPTEKGGHNTRSDVTCSRITNTTMTIVSIACCVFSRKSITNCNIDKIGEYASIHPNLWWIIFMFRSRFKCGQIFFKCFKRYDQFNLTNPQWRFELECVKSLDFQACWAIARYVVLGLGLIPLNTPQRTNWLKGENLIKWTIKLFWLFALK